MAKCCDAAEGRNGWRCKGGASALLVRTSNQETMASDFCPEIYCTAYRNKATEQDLFPLRTPIAKPFPNAPSGGSAAGDGPCRTRRRSSCCWVTESCSQQIQNTNKHGLRRPDLTDMCVFPLDITNETDLELANTRTLCLFWTVPDFLRIWMSKLQEKTRSHICSC